MAALAEHLLQLQLEFEPEVLLGSERSAAAVADHLRTDGRRSFDL